MKLLIIYHAGAMQNPRQLYHALAHADKVELTVAVPRKIQLDKVYDGGCLSVDREESHDGYRLVPVPLNDPANYQRGFQKEGLRQVIKDTKADIIHVLDEPCSGYLFQVVWQRFRTSPRSKVLFYGFENLPWRFGWLSHLKWKLTWLQVAGGAAANTETLENLKRAGFPQGRPLERVFWGISTDIFRPMDRLSLRRELALDCQHTVGFVGRLVAEKGLMVLLAAMLSLPTRVHCVIIGSGPLQAQLQILASLPDLRGRIHFYDVMNPEALARYMNCMDVLVLPSLTTPYWKEQYGRVIGEAMACGVPVVGSDSGAIPEVIGPAGLIVQEQDASKLSEALQTLIFDQEVRAGLVQEGLQRAERDLSVVAMSQRLLDFYHRLLRN